jgi:hypothetical protein
MSLLAQPGMTQLEAGAIPVHMRYSQSLNEIAVSGERTKRKFFVQGNNSFNPASNIATILMNFSPDNDLLDTANCSLVFSVTASGITTESYLDSSSFQFINRLTVRDNSGQILDSVPEYGSYINSIYPFSTTKAGMDSSSILGFPNANGLAVLEGVATGGSLLDLGEISGNQSYSFPTTGATHTFSIPLLGSAVFSAHLNNSSSYLPVALLNGQALQVEVQFETNLKKIFKTVTAAGLPSTYSISNVFMECAVTTVDGNVMRKFKEDVKNNGGLMMSSQMVTNTQYTPSSLTSTYNVNASGRSVRSLIVAATAPGTAGNTVASAKLPVKSLQIQANSKYLPSYPLTTIPELLNEVSSALGVPRSFGIINNRNYGTDFVNAFSGAGSSIISRAICGIDMDRWRDPSKEAGISLMNSLLTVYLTLGGTNAAPTVLPAGAIINNWIIQDTTLYFRPDGTVVNMYQ